MLPITRIFFGKIAISLALLFVVSLVGYDDFNVFAVAILPFIAAVGALIATHLRKNSIYIKVTGNFLSSVAVFVIVVFISLYVRAVSNYYSVEFAPIAALILGLVFVSFAINKLYTKSIVGHEEWIAENGLFLRSKIRKIKPVLYVQAPVSSADEISKLSKLHEQGIISENEFEAAKRKLLQ